jgi:hypothetical protein
MGRWGPWLNMGVALAHNPSSVRVGALSPAAGRTWSSVRMFTLGLRYFLSPNTSLNAHDSVIDDQGENFYTFSNLDALPSLPGHGHRAFSLGLQHRF